MDRPKIILIKTGFDLFLERTTLVVLIFLWIYVIISYPSLPEIIPAHYGFNGKADRYGNKIIIFLLPAILSVIIIGIRFLNGFSYKFNYPVPITKENAETQYRIATRMLRVINFIIAIAFSFISIKEIYDSKQPVSVLNWWFLPAFLIALFGATGYFIWKGFKVK